MTAQTATNEALELLQNNDVPVAITLTLTDPTTAEPVPNWDDVTVEFIAETGTTMLLLTSAGADPAITKQPQADPADPTEIVVMFARGNLAVPVVGTYVVDVIDPTVPSPPNSDSRLTYRYDTFRVRRTRADGELIGWSNDTVQAAIDAAVAIIEAGDVDSVDGRTGTVTLADLYQPLDSDLTAIAALTTTSFGRALLALADAAAGRTALGLGTAATQASGAFDAAGAAAAAQAASQPLDSDLTAIAALTTTSYGRSLLAAADASAAGTILALPATYAPLPIAMQVGRYYRLPNGSQSTGTMTTARMRAVPKFIPNNLTLTRLGMEVTIIGDVGSKIRLGIYADDGTFRPGALVLDAGTINGDSATVQEITISQALTRGWYWFVGCTQVVTVTQPTVRTLVTPQEPDPIDYGTSAPGAAAVTTGVFLDGVTGALPTPFGAATPSSTGMPTMFGKVGP